MNVYILPLGKLLQGWINSGFGGPAGAFGKFLNTFDYAIAIGLFVFVENFKQEEADKSLIYKFFPISRVFQVQS